MENIVWIGFSHGLFAAILMLTKRKRSVSDQILTAWLFLLAIEFLSAGIDVNLFGAPLLSSAFLLFNPAFYLYVKSLTNANFKLRYVQLLHLLPYVIFKIAAYVLQEPYTLSEFFEHDSSLWFRIVFSASSLISWVSYNSISAALVVQHRKKLKNEFSTLESDMKLGWLLFVVIFYNLFCGIAVIIGTLSVLMSVTLPITPVFIFSNLLFLVYIFSFWGLIQKEVLIKGNGENIVQKKYAKSGLTDAQKTKIKNLILESFESERPYLNPDFNMSMLSDSLSLPKYQLTEVLNSKIGKNFFSFVNEYRVEEVKKQLAKINHPYSIEAIGYECGFSSKSTFFTVFKKTTGLTPTEYKKSLEE